MDLKLNRNYQFTTLAPAILGGTFNNMKVVGIMTLKEAIAHRDVMTVYNSVKGLVPALPAVTDCTYILFLQSSGEKLLLAQEFIDVNSIVELTVTNCRIDILDTTSETVSLARAALLAQGITNFTITLY